jgi:hypothetical protein
LRKNNRADYSHQADKAAREKDAALQVAWISPTVLVHSLGSLQREARRSFQALAPPFGSPDRADAGRNSGE